MRCNLDLVLDLHLDLMIACIKNYRLPIAWTDCIYCCWWWVLHTEQILNWRIYCCWWRILQKRDSKQTGSTVVSDGFSTIDGSWTDWVCSCRWRVLSDWLKGSHGLHIFEIWFPARDKTKNQKPQTYLYCHRLDSKLHLPSVDLDSKFTGVVKSAKIAESDDLVWPNRKRVILTTILDALTHSPAPNAPVTAFRLPTERLSHVRTP